MSTLNTPAPALKLGIMTNKELADWFGISEASFKNTKRLKLEELKTYAEFETIKGKVNIKRILSTAAYEKRSARKKELIKDNFVNELPKDTMITTCSEIAADMCETLDLDLSYETVCAYTREARNELFGNPSEESNKGGTVGSCYYLWCIKEPDLDRGEGYYKYRQMTKEENEIKEKILTNYYKKPVKAVEATMLVKSMVISGEITKDEAWDQLERMTGFNDNNTFWNCLDELQRELGATVIRGTKFELLNTVMNNEMGEKFLEEKGIYF